MKGWVTLYTDASYYPDQCLSSYAFWIRTDSGRDKVYDICPSFIQGSFQAEYYAIYQGLLYIDSHYDEVPGVVVCSDCEQALKQLWPWITAHDSVFGMRQEIDQIRSHTDIRTKWVKGHGSGKSTSSYLNNWCDSAAKRVIKHDSI